MKSPLPFGSVGRVPYRALLLVHISLFASTKRNKKKNLSSLDRVVFVLFISVTSGNHRLAHERPYPQRE
jgi:hypothetical protein